jgi:acyl carrier protein
MKTEEEIGNAVLDAIRKATGSKDFAIQDSDEFSAHDIDSLDQMSILVDVEEALGLDFGDLDPATLTCIRDYIRHVQSM